MKRRHGVSRRRLCPISRQEGRWARYEAPEAAQCEQQGLAEGIGAALEAARRPEARHLAHEQSEIQAADMQEHALEDVAVSAQMHPAQPRARDRGRRRDTLAVLDGGTTTVASRISAAA